jgi:hypothetical protein
MRSGVGKRAKVILGVQYDSITCTYGVLRYRKGGFIVKAIVRCANVMKVAKSCQLRNAVIEAPSRIYVKNFTRKCGNLCHINLCHINFTF